MKNVLFTLLIFKTILWEVLSGFTRHSFGLVCSKSKNVNIFAYSLARGIRVAFDHQHFTVHRFRLLNVIPDYFSGLWTRWKMSLVSELVLGRNDDQNMSYNIVKEGTVTKFIPGYMENKGLTCQHWNIRPIAEILGVAQYSHKEDRASHLGPNPMIFSSRFLVPKNKTMRETTKWILYVPGYFMFI
eukprot:NODE_816_length_3944_cov_0.511573.p2 type:complete len:186 gc:universal NODE_816_length_3944_cov_0.511573:1425-1982(+)